MKILKKIGYLLLAVFLLLIGTYFWFATCISLYVYSLDYLIKNKSSFGTMMIADLVTKTGSCKMRNYDSFLISILKSEIREQPVCDKCVGKLGMLANASLNKKYPGNNIPFLTEDDHSFSLNLIDPHTKIYSFLGIEDLNTFVKIDDKDYEYMKSLWETIEQRRKENHKLNWHSTMSENDWKKYTENEKNIPEKVVLMNFSNNFNQISIEKWEKVIR